MTKYQNLGLLLLASIAAYIMLGLFLPQILWNLIWEIGTLEMLQAIALISYIQWDSKRPQKKRMEEERLKQLVEEEVARFKEKHPLTTTA